MATGIGAMNTLEAIEETLEILSQLQLNGVVYAENSDKLSQYIQQLHQIRFNLKMKENQNV
jgi:hypothetical protein